MSFDATAISAAEAAFARRFATGHFPAWTMAAQKGAGAPLVMTAGTVSVDDPTPVPDDAQWHIGSITKTFTATLVMMLLEERRLSLDDTLGALLDAHLPDLAAITHADWRDATLRQMLSHRAGLPPNPTRAQMMARPTAEALLPQVLAEPRRGKVGKFAYSNISYMLAGQIAAAVGGAPWWSQIQTRIAAPLGLTSLGLAAPSPVLGHRRRWFRPLPVPPAEPWSDNPPAFDAAGRMHASARDMLTFGRFLLDAQAGRSALLSAESFAAMQPTGARPPYGAGLARFRMAKTGWTVLGHDGSNTMWEAFFGIVPERDMVLFTCASARGPMRLIRGATLVAAALEVGVGA